MNKMFSWIPTIITVISLIGGGAVAYKTIGDNTESLSQKVNQSEFENHKNFTLDSRIRLATDIQDLEESMDEAEDKIDDLDRSDLQSAGDLKLQIERLSNQQRLDRAAMERQLNLILQMLQERPEN